MGKNKHVPIRYVARDFQGIKESLVEHAKRYYSDIYRDFSEASFGSLVMDMVAYIGDVLSFYIDYNTNESFLLTANEFKNIIKLARQNGYKFRTANTAFGEITTYVIVPAKTVGLGPDSTYIPILLKGTEFISKSGNSYLLNNDINFSDSKHDVMVATVNAATGYPTHYAIKAKGQVISGKLYEQVVSIESFSKFRKIYLDKNNICEVMSVVDESGREYYEVEHLSQNVIWRLLPNVDQQTDSVSSIFKPFIAARRFVVEQDGAKTYIQFGHGSEKYLSENDVADPSEVVLNVFGKNYVSSTTVDPTKLVNNDKFGISPSNTKLRIIYRSNTGANVNAGVKTISKIATPQFRFVNEHTLDSGKLYQIINSIECENEEAMVGDVSTLDADELKTRSIDYITAQDRAVTEQDYRALLYSLPPQLGTVKRVSILQDTTATGRNLNLYLLGESSDGTLTTANSTVKKNIRSWILSKKMINDTIDIMDAKIVNLKINFVAIANRGIDKEIALERAITTLMNKFKIKLDIGEPFYISNVYSALNAIPAIADVISVKVTTLSGGSYSDHKFNLNAFLSNDGRSINAPKNVVFEIKYPKRDIVGSLK